MLLARTHYLGEVCAKVAASENAGLAFSKTRMSLKQFTIGRFMTIYLSCWLVDYDGDA